MDLDIRSPIGLLFVALGGLLVAYGLASDPAIYAAHSLGLNVNLGWGLALLAFGAFMLVLTRLRRKR
jgi:hypothetical protein